jgi:N-acyl-D-aspartate/D-glutamate deacylase
VITGVHRFRSVPEGFLATIVNGEVVVENGQRTGARPGQVVRPG